MWGSVATWRRARQLRILLVDDNVDGVETLAELLRASGYTVATAHDGLEGLARFESFIPDLAILDLGLPSLDGFMLAGRVRTQQRFRTIPLIALSAYDLPSHKHRAKLAGFDHHLSKPADLARLETLLLQYSGVRDGA